MWRYGRPQSGRYREFRQFDVEVIGAPEAGADVEVIAVADRLPARPGPEPASARGEQHRRRGLPAGVPGAADRVPRGQRGSGSATSTGTGSATTRSGSSTARTRPAGPWPKAPRRSRTELCGPAREHFDAVQAGLRDEGVEFRPPANAGPRPRLLHAHGVRIRGRRAVRGPGRRCAAAAGTTGWPRSSAGRPRRASDSPRAWTGSCWPWRGRHRDPCRSRRLDCFVVAVGDGGASRPPQSGPGPARGRRLRPWRRSTSVSLKAQLRMADRHGARYAVIVGEREAEAGTVTPSDSTTATRRT